MKARGGSSPARALINASDDACAMGRRMCRPPPFDATLARPGSRAGDGRGRGSGRGSGRAIHRHHGKVVGVNLGFLFLLPTQLFLCQPELLAASLELGSAPRFLGGVDVVCEAFDRDTGVQTIDAVACLGGVLIAFEQHAVQGHPVLHEIGDRHGRQALRTAAGAAQDGHGYEAADNMSSRVRHMSVWYTNPGPARVRGCDAAHAFAMCGCAVRVRRELAHAGPRRYRSHP